MKTDDGTMKSKPYAFKKIPTFKTDEGAANFVEKADLTEYDLSEFRPFRFEFQKEEARVNMRLPASLLEAVKAEARDRGIPYQRFIREAVERAIAPINKKAS